LQGTHLTLQGHLFIYCPVSLFGCIPATGFCLPDGGISFALSGLRTLEILLGARLHVAQLILSFQRGQFTLLLDTV
jgi:hypothetical protein